MHLLQPFYVKNILYVSLHVSKNENHSECDRISQKQTLFAGTFGVSQSGVTAFIISDTVINCWCIFLMYSENKKIFDYCCCGLCSMCCLKCFLKKEAERLGVDVTDVIAKSPRISSEKNMSLLFGGRMNKKTVDTSTGAQNNICENTREIPIDSSMKETGQSTTGSDNIVTITSAPVNNNNNGHTDNESTQQM